MKKLIFGITGGTGAGKTTVSQSFEKLGVNVIDADKIYHSLIKKGMPCFKELIKYFGDGVLDNNGELNRRALAAIVFADSKKLEKLNEITHRYIKEKICSLMEGDGIYAIDGAALIGSPVQSLCEYMVAVVADEDIRLERIMKRDDLNIEEARRRIGSQRKNGFYIDNSDYVIYNNGGNDMMIEAKKALAAMDYERSIDG